ncbi:MAG TPA: FAD-dependent oxidoreductase [Gemmataceae bacterium]|nr:FAD-dependent oxidoreductase [Gemmataceae bacterium]
MYDAVIVGQGLAGTVLAWTLRPRRVLLIDREDAVTSSKIAAGLITPITGKRLAVADRWGELWPVAVAFYRRVEAETGARFFHEGPAVRLFADAGERELFEQRNSTGWRHWSSPLPQSEHWGRGEQPSPEPNLFAPHGGFEMPAARLDVPQFLAVSRDFFRPDYLAADIDPAHDIELLPDRVRLPRLGVETECLVFCQGYSPNPHFPDVTFNAAKGEILTLRIPGLAETRVVHRGVWLVPLGDERFLAGSTYEWEQLDTVPTATRRDEICARVREFVRLPFEVIDHTAAVRPVIDAGKPVVEVRGRLGIFNGLGSKGALLAPFFATRLL